MPDAAPEIIFRQAVPADVDFLREALGKLDREMRELTKASAIHLEGPTGLNIESHLQRDVFLIAVRGEESCGFQSIWFPYPSPEKALVPPRQQATINTLYVLPKFRRQGIASMLLGAAEAKCRAPGATGIGLGFIEGNHAAEAAYKKAGYAPTRHAMWLSLD